MRYRKNIITLLSIILLTLPLSIYAQSIQQEPLKSQENKETSDIIEEKLNETNALDNQSEITSETNNGLESETQEEKTNNKETIENIDLEEDKEKEVVNEQENKEGQENLETDNCELQDEAIENNLNLKEQAEKETPEEIKKEDPFREQAQIEESTNIKEENKPEKQDKIQDSQEDESNQAIEPNIIEDRMVNYERYFDAGGILGGTLINMSSWNSNHRPYMVILKNKKIELYYENGILYSYSEFGKARLERETTIYGGNALDYKLKLTPINEDGSIIYNNNEDISLESSDHRVGGFGASQRKKGTYNIGKLNETSKDLFLSAQHFRVTVQLASAFAGTNDSSNNYTLYTRVEIKPKNVKGYDKNEFGFGSNLENYVEWQTNEYIRPAEFVGEPTSSIDYGKIDDSDDKDSYYLNLKTSFKPNASENFSLLAVNSPKDCDCQWKRYIVMDNVVALGSDTITKEMKFKLGIEAPDNHRYQVQYYLIDNSKIEAAELSDLFDGERTDDHSKFQSLEKDAIIAKSPVSTHYLTINYAVKDAVIFEKNMLSENPQYLDNKISYYLKLGFELESSYCFGVKEPKEFKIHLDLKNESIIAEEPVTNVILNTDIDSRKLLNFTKIEENIDEGKHSYTFDLLISLKDKTDLQDMINHLGTFSITSKIIKGDDIPIRSSYKEVDIAQQKSIYTYVIDEMEFPSVENIKSQRIFVDERPVMKTEAQLFQLEKFKEEFINKNENFAFYKLAELKNVDEVIGIYGLNDEESNAVVDDLSKNEIVQENPLYISFYIKGKLVDSQTHQLQFLLNKLTRKKVGDDYYYKYEGTAVFDLENKIMPRDDNDIGLDGINPFLIYTKGFGDSHKITAKLEKKLEEGPRLELDLYIEIFSVDNFGFKNNDYPDTIYDKDDIRKITSEDNNPLELDIATDNDFNGIAIIVRPIKDDNNKLVAMTKARYISDKPMKEGDLSQHNIKWTINSTLRTHE